MEAVDSIPKSPPCNRVSQGRSSTAWPSPPTDIGGVGLTRLIEQPNKKESLFTVIEDSSGRLSGTMKVKVAFLLVRRAWEAVVLR